MKKNLDTYKGKSFYKVYHQPTAEEFYFSFKPKVGELKMLARELEAEDLEEFDITIHKFTL